MFVTSLLFFWLTFAPFNSPQDYTKGIIEVGEIKPPSEQNTVILDDGSPF